MSENSGRLLSFGSATELVPAPAEVGDEWHELLKALDDPAAILQCLVLAHPDTTRLLTQDLPQLYRSLRTTSRAKPTIARGGLPGPPLWHETVRARAAAGGDNTVYVVATTARSSDVPENRGLACCLTFLDGLVGSLARRAGGPMRLPKALQTTAEEVRTGLRLPALRDLPIETRLSVRSREAMKRNRHGAFERIANLFVLLSSYREKPRADLISSLAGAGWLAPLSDDDLFELLVLCTVIEQLQKSWGSPGRLSPIVMEGAIAEWPVSTGLVGRVYFNTVPVELRRASRYLRTARRHPGLFNASARRPDIIVSLHRKERVAFTLVEVKNPAPGNTEYRRESLYKCFGYFHDYGDALECQEDEEACFLVFPGAVHEVGESSDPVSVVSGDEGHELPLRLSKRLERAAKRLEGA